MIITMNETTKAASRPFNWRPVKIWALYVVGLLPAAWYFYLGATGDLGADPVRTFEHLLGIWALRFILATLSVTPLVMLFNFRIMPYRRALGLLGFWYVLFHFTVYVTLDRGLNLSGIIEDIAKRWYITIGMAGFLMLIPLALTSNSYSIRKLGKRWAKLHKLVYAVVAAGTLHFVLSTKSLSLEQAIYVALAAGLLLFRVFKPNIARWRKQHIQKRKNDASRA